MMKVARTGLLTLCGAAAITGGGFAIEQRFEVAYYFMQVAFWLLLGWVGLVMWWYKSISEDVCRDVRQALIRTRHRR